MQTFSFCNTQPHLSALTFVGAVNGWIPLAFVSQVSISRLLRWVETLSLPSLPAQPFFLLHLSCAARWRARTSTPQTSPLQTHICSFNNGKNNRATIASTTRFVYQNYSLTQPHGSSSSCYVCSPSMRK